MAVTVYIKGSVAVDRFAARAAGRAGQARAIAVRPPSAALALGPLSACASPAPPTSGLLTSYSGLTKTRAHRAHAFERVDSIALAAAKTVRLETVTFAEDAQSRATPAQRAQLANALERALCKKLSARFKITTASDSADLTIKTVVTRIKPTNAAAAGHPPGF